mmetsp:Transcript_33737/g.94943  ORF Transcript_33737/g.94943 Transcript_33737/m.94943 type:complete len:86 (+) Transcript_33737:231-488(+)
MQRIAIAAGHVFHCSFRLCFWASVGSIFKFLVVVTPHYYVYARNMRPQRFNSFVVFSDGLGIVKFFLLLICDNDCFFLNITFEAV